MSSHSLFPSIYPDCFTNETTKEGSILYFFFNHSSQKPIGLRCNVCFLDTSKNEFILDPVTNIVKFSFHNDSVSVYPFSVLVHHLLKSFETVSFIPCPSLNSSELRGPNLFQDLFHRRRATHLMDDLQVMGDRRGCLLFPF